VRRRRAGSGNSLGEKITAQLSAVSFQPWQEDAELRQKFFKKRLQIIFAFFYFLLIANSLMLNAITIV
jgi:hypothetical protein